MYGDINVNGQPVISIASEYETMTKNVTLNCQQDFFRDNPTILYELQGPNQGLEFVGN